MDEFDALLRELIALRPVSEEIAAVNRVSDRVAAFAAAHGLYTEVEDIGGRRTVFVATVPGKTPDFLLNAHVDVVPAVTPDQYEAKEKDGILYARGTDDCLGNAVAILRFLCTYKGKCSAGGVFSTDEEIGGHTTGVMLERGYCARKMILVLDCWDNGNILCAQKGIINMRLTAAGRGGHASTPWLFDNPVDKLLDGYRKLRDAWTNPTGAEPWGDSMAPCILAAGSVANQIPDTASMTINFRYIDPAGRDALIEKVKTLTGLDVSLGEVCPPVITSTDSPALKAFRDIAADELGNPAVTFTRMNGATDARYWIRAGVPLAIYGVHGFGCHSASEGVYLDSLPRLQRILTRLADGIVTNFL